MDFSPWGVGSQSQPVLRHVVTPYARVTLAPSTDRGQASGPLNYKGIDIRYSFQVDDRTHLDRFLILGAEGGPFPEPAHQE